MNNRTRLIKSGIENKGPVVYWMSRDQRIHDNWALLAAMHYAKENKKPVIIVFNLVTEFLNAGRRQFTFMVNGLREVYETASEYNLPFFFLEGDPATNIPEFIKEVSASILFTDFDPLSIKRKWLKEAASGIDIKIYETDAHNIVPAFLVSQRQEFSAAHFRRKITLLLTEYLDEYPAVWKMDKSDFNSLRLDFDSIVKEFRNPPFEVDSTKPGPDSAFNTLEEFLSKKLDRYILKNDPNSNTVSGLSPYLHFGSISAQRIALNIEKMNFNSESKASFLDELIVRKELSDNYCYYNTDFDSFNGFPEWAKIDLNKHREDEREFVYSSDQFEKANTHDALWNTAQNEMTMKGKMHGYMRMYWCKKILEWSASPEEALKIAIYLNDKYQLDGRDPNGYTGIAWSIGGLHDRPFAERPVYGRVRYMNYNGCKRKFDVTEYIDNNQKPES